MTARLVAVDWCCGDGGMTRGMQAAGFDVVGVDVVRRPVYPAQLVLADVTALQGRDLPPATWDHFSPPCARFSLARGNRLEDPVTDADLDILRACIRLRDERASPYWTIENVRGAVKWFTPLLGPPRLQNGPHFFWGNFPPFLCATSKPAVKGGRNYAKSHRAWTRARVPMHLAGPMAAAIAQAAQAADDGKAAGLEVDDGGGVA